MIFDHQSVHRVASSENPTAALRQMAFSALEKTVCLSILADRVIGCEMIDDELNERLVSVMMFEESGVFKL